ncbi:MAG: hypothetical protein LBV41_08515 [Cytophagaceae bacterium]|jgi:hypothetical protein|nr:hypothetical protein [Cytophagaceae bacterium]
MKHIFIGIDPDIHKSGVCAWDRTDKTLDMQSLSFFQLFDYLSKYKDSINRVRVEAGWLNEKSNFHTRFNQTKEAGERIAKNVGANHETGKKIIEMCVYLGLEVEPVKPLGKITPDYFEKLTGIKCKNQDIIDAAMLVYEL